MINFDFNHTFKKNNLNFEYKNINLDKPITAIYGPSGSGKSTLLRLIMGLERPISGKLLINNNIYQEKDYFLPPEKRPISFVQQSNYLFPHINVEKNIYFNANHSFGDTYTESVLDLFDLHDLLNSNINNLSGGQKRKVVLARAFLNHHELLILDEPFNGIDKKTIHNIHKFLNEHVILRDVKIIYASHDIKELAVISNSMIVINDQTVSHQGDIQSVLLDEDFYNLNLCRPQSIILMDKGESVFFNTIVNASDVALSRQSIMGTSIRNQIKGKIIKIIDIANDRVIVQVDCGNYSLLSEITKESHLGLQLATEDEIYCLIKTSSFK